jgi:hypothetical protein
MREISEIKAEIDNLEALPSYYGNEWKKPLRDKLQAEMFRALTASIPLDRLSAICQAEREGRCVVLDEQLAMAMCAGARAIEQRGRGTYVWDVLGNPKEMPYVEAAKALRSIAVPLLNARAEAAKDGDRHD